MTRNSETIEYNNANDYYDESGIEMSNTYYDGETYYGENKNYVADANPTYSQ